MQNINEANFSKILSRIYAVTQTCTQVELAEFLGIRQSSISDAKKRKSVPDKWLVKLLQKKQINPDWILTGQEPRFLRPEETGEESYFSENTSPRIVQVVQKKLPEECTTEELMAEVMRRVMKIMR